MESHICLVIAGILTNNGEAIAAAVTIQNPSASENMPADGAGWVDLFVREMMSATSVDDAKSHVSKLLAVLENSINKRAAEETAQNFQKVLSLNHLWISIYHSFSGLARGLQTYEATFRQNAIWTLNVGY